MAGAVHMAAISSRAFIIIPLAQAECSTVHRVTGGMSEWMNDEDDSGGGG